MPFEKAVRTFRPLKIGLGGEGHMYCNLFQE